MRRQKRFSFVILLCILSGILLWLSWPEKGFTPLIFVALAPLFIAEQAFYVVNRRRNAIRMFGNFYLTLLIWNALTTWWIWNATDAGSLVAIGVNTLFMTIVWQIFYLVKRRQGTVMGYTTLIILWVGFEYLHLSWELSWPWLTLGNVFATHPAWVQWYEYTGVLGGSLWILVINLLVFQLLKNLWYKDLLLRLRKINVIIITGITCIAIAGPLILSLYMYHNYNEKGDSCDVVLLQPNVDPYNEKFSGTGKQQLDRMLKQIAETIDTNTKYVIGPETAIPDGIQEEEIEVDESVNSIRKLIVRYPKLNMIIGLTSFRTYLPGDKVSATARKYKNDDFYFDVYNSAMLLSDDDPIQVYHKSRLVPGVETMPYPKVFGFLEKYALKLGGTSGSLGRQTRRANFVSNDGTKVAPSICYESIYGDFMSAYMRDSAQFITVITNDGWWGNTPGYRQHMNYSRLLAVEFRKDIARSANTGISCFISQRGDVTEKSEWWVPAVMKGKVYKNPYITFYARHGDYIGFACAFLAVTIIIYLIFRRIIHLF